MGKRIKPLKKKTRVEWHQDKGSLHIVFFSEINVTKKRIKFKNKIKDKDKEKDEDRVPGIEVRSNELLIVSPSVHGDGNSWTPLGTDQNAALTNEELLRLEAKIGLLSGEGYSADDDDKRPYIGHLEDPATKIKEGGRHDAVKIFGCSYFFRYKDGWKDLTDDEKRDKLKEWNLQHCNPPLPDSEFSEIWKWIVKTHSKTRDKQFEESNEKARSAQAEANSPVNMPGCISYQISDTPAIWITGTPDNKLIEVMRKTKPTADGLLTTLYLTRKTFTQKPSFVP